MWIYPAETYFMFTCQRIFKRHHFPTMSNLLHNWVVTVEMCRKRDLNLGTSISNPLCSADPLPDCWTSIFYAVFEPQQGHLLSVTSSLLLKRSSCFEHMKPRHSASQQQKVMTFKWGRSNVAALWFDLINWCHRKWIVSLSRVTATVQQHVHLSSDVISGWRQRSGTETIALLRIHAHIHVHVFKQRVFPHPAGLSGC